MCRDWTLELLTVAFDESTMSRTQVQLWYNRFKEGQEDVNDDASPMKTLWIWIIIESLLESLLMMLAYRSAHAKQILRMF